MMLENKIIHKGKSNSKKNNFETCYRVSDDVMYIIQQQKRKPLT